MPLTEALTRSFSAERVMEPGNVLQLLARASGAFGEGLLGLIVVLGCPLTSARALARTAYLTVLLHPLVLAAAADS